jgi:hypothetical protein
MDVNVMTWEKQILLAALIAWLILWVEHWFPWQAAIKRELPHLARYVLGVLGMLVPLSLLFSGAFGYTPVRFPTPGLAYLQALWIVAGVSGAAVVCAYVIDWLIGRVAISGDLQEILELYRHDTRQTDEESGG